MNWVAILCCTMLAMITCLVPQSLMGGRSAIRFIQNHQRRANWGYSLIAKWLTVTEQSGERNPLVPFERTRHYVLVQLNIGDGFMAHSILTPAWVPKLESVVKNSTSYADVIRALNLSKSGSKYTLVRRWVTKLGIPVDHFCNTGGFSQGHTRSTIPDHDVLVDNCPHDQTVVRRVAKRLLPLICQECSIGGTYNDKPLVLQLDHINGKNNDNRIENLRWLCPNCHSQTLTWGAKRNDSSPRKRKPRILMNCCATCSTPCKQKYCSKKCVTADFRTRGVIGVSKIIWPPNDTLSQMVDIDGYEKTGRNLGVSGNAVKKHLQKSKVSNEDVENPSLIQMLIGET